MGLKFSKYGMTTTRKIALAVPLLLILVLGVYVALGSGRPGAVSSGPQSTSSASSTGTVSNEGARQINSILGLFGNFSRMVVVSSYVEFADGEVQSTGGAHLSYTVLGQAVVNSTRYYKVEFTDLNANKSEIAWFNPQGLVDRVDVPGDRNYTGPTASFYAETFIADFSIIPSLSSNSTILSGLQKIGEGVQSIGPTQMDVVTYGLAAPTSSYSNFTIKAATVPGANVELVVYSYQESPNTSSSLFEVTSATRA